MINCWINCSFCILLISSFSIFSLKLRFISNIIDNFIFLSISGESVFSNVINCEVNSTIFWFFNVASFFSDSSRTFLSGLEYVFFKQIKISLTSKEIDIKKFYLIKYIFEILFIF